MRAHAEKEAPRLRAVVRVTVPLVKVPYRGGVVEVGGPGRVHERLVAQLVRDAHVVEG